jgi:prepilin-type N-terminal cleavage/methylation domain-containing protein
MINIPWRPRKSGVTLIELMCVILIISIMAALLLGACFRAFRHARHVLGHS